MIKKLLRPDRLRLLAHQFGWIDQQLIRRGHLRDCDHPAWALYLFLTTVSDAQGLSYYSDASTMRLVKLDPTQLSAARHQLTRAGLLCYQKPLYQLLALPDEHKAELPAAPRSGQTRSLAEVLRSALEGGAA